MNYKEHPYYREMNLDSFFQYGWELYRKNFAWFFMYSFLAMIILQTINSYLLGPYIEDVYTLAENPENLGNVLGDISLMLASSVIIYTIIGLFLSYLVLNLSKDKGMGHLSLFSESMSKHFFSLLGATILSGIILIFGTFLGVFALVIGALIAAFYFGTVFFPLTPIVILEKSNPIEAISRSFKMVHSDFWKTLGFVAVLIIIYIVVSLVLGALTMIPFATDFMDLMSNPESLEASEITGTMLNPLQLILSSISNALLLPFFPIFGILLYLNLKHKEDQGINKADLLEQIGR